MALACLAAAVLVLVGVALSASPPSGTGGGVTVGTGVTFRPSQSWVDLNFSTPQTFQSAIRIGPTWVAFDNVSIAMQKAPAGLPRAAVSVTTWAPAAGANSTAIQFSAVGATNASVAFNVTGLRTDVSYFAYLDGALIPSRQSPGGVSFEWSNSTDQTFSIVAVPPSANPPPNAPGGDTIPPAQVTNLQADAWGPDFVLLKWTAPGNNGSVGRASAYDVRYSSKGPLSAANFTNATPIPMSPPQPAGSTETLNVTGLTPDTEYWFALRTADAVPNWSPLSDVVDVRTLKSWVGVPSVAGVSFDPMVGLLEVSFSEPMNQTSVETSVAIYPAVPFNVSWHGGAQLAITLQANVTPNTAYFLTISPRAADQDGIPMARNFTFKFVGPPSGQPILVLGIPAIVLVPLVAGFVAVGSVAGVTYIRLARNRRKMRLLHNAMALLARRVSATKQVLRVRDRSARPAPATARQRPKTPPRSKR